MNKKIYTTPALQIVSVNPTHMLANSLEADSSKTISSSTNWTKDEGDWDDDLWDD